MSPSASAGGVLHWVAIVAGAAVAVVVVGMIAAALLFDPNAYRDDIEAAFLARTGRTLDFTGELSMSLFPWFGVDTGPAEVGNRDGFAGQPFVSWTNAHASVRVLPLVRRRVEIGRVELDGLRLNLEVDTDGRDNWSDLVERLTTGETQIASNADESAGDHVPVDLSIAGLTLRDARLVHHDRQAGTRFEVRDGAGETGRLRAGQPFDVQASLAIIVGEAPPQGVELSTRLDLSEPGRVTMDGTAGRLELRRRARPGEPLPVELRVAQFAYDVEARTARFDGLSLETASLALIATLESTRTADGFELRGPVSFGESQPRPLLRWAGLEPTTRDATALARLTGSAGLLFTGRRLELDPLTLELDESRIEGHVRVTDLRTRALEFDLAVDRLDLDRYRSPPATAPKAPSASTASTAPDAAAAAAATRESRSDTSQAYESLRRLALAGKLRIGRLTVAAIPWNDVRLQLSADEGVLAANPATARAFGGRVATSLRADLREPAPALRLEANFDDVDAAAMLGKLLDVHQLTGRGRARTTLDARGRTGDELLGSLRGRFDLSVTDGRLLGSDLWREIEVAVAAAQRKAPPPGGSSGGTEFRQLSGNGTIAGRVMHLARLDFASDFLKVQGGGDVNFASGTLDLDLTAKLLKVPKGRVLGVKLSRLVGANVPVDVTGPIADPQIRPNVSVILGTVVIDTITQPLEGKARKKLDELIGR